MAIWRLITSDPDPLDAPQEALHWYINHDVIALGWGEIGDLRNLNNPTQQGIAQSIGARLPHVKAPAVGGRCLWDFWQEMEVGDSVILRFDSVNHRVVEVIDDYFYDDDVPLGIPEYFRGYSHRRHVKHAGYRADADNLWRNTHLAPGYNKFWALNLLPPN